MGIKRTAYASSIASLALPPGGRIKKHSMAPTSWRMRIARLSIGLTGRCLLSGCVQMLCMGWGGIGDEFENTTAIHAAVAGSPYTIPYSGAYSWLYAGEAAAAFIAAAGFEPEGASVFDLNGRCERLERWSDYRKEIAPDRNFL